MDTLIPFFGNKPIRLYGYENRVIPFNSKVPLQVIVSFPNTKTANYEYFRIDSSKYLVYEYFRNGKLSSNNGVKSRGSRIVKDSIVGKFTTRVHSIGFDDEDSDYFSVSQFKYFPREGEWEEYEDSVFHHIYWTGVYKNDKRAGLWKRHVYGIGDEFLLEEIDYDSDSSKRLFISNIVYTIPIDSLSKMLTGTWNLRSCDSEKDKRMFYTVPSDGNEKTDNFTGDGSKYYFHSNKQFSRWRSEGCNKFKESMTNGTWKMIEQNNQRFMEIVFPNGQTWKLKILYFDNEFNLVTDRL